MKAGSRKRKIDLILCVNPNWEDLFPNLSNDAVEELRRIKNHFK